MAAVVAENVAELAAPGTKTDAGTLRVELVLDRVTLAPPGGAAPVRVTVQGELLLMFRMADEQDRELMVGDAPPPAVTIPPVAETTTAAPAGDEPMLLLIPIAVVPAIVRLITAMVPFAMMPALIPETMQVYAPEVPAQSTDLPAAVAAGPELAEMETTLLGEYVNVH